MLTRDPWVKKAKWLTQALIISGTLNVGLLSTFIYFAMNENHRPVAELQSPNAPRDLSEKRNLQDLLTTYSTFSFQDLLLRIGNHDHVESGYTKRDLALACLVAFHHFNIEKALGGMTLQKREVTFTHKENNEGITLTVFSGLANYQYEAIVHFAKTEKWPLTAQGLFFELQSTKPPYDPSLLETFYLTPEFHFTNLLFTKTGIALKKEYVAALLANGSWETLSETCQHLRMNSEFTPEERRRFLLQLTDEKSRLAAKVLLEADQDYCLQTLSDDQVLYLCELLGDKSTPSFLKELLLSPRSDDIWKKAASLLYVQAAEEIPVTLDLTQAKRRFIELKSEPQKVTPKKTTGKTYTVASGDSLWKIAHQNKTTIKAIKEANNLQTDSLRPGQQLTIP